MDRQLSPHNLHTKALVIDGHSDIPVDIVKRRRAGEKNVLLRCHLPDWRSGGVNASFMAVAGDESCKDSPYVYTMESIAYLKADIAESPKQFSLVRTAKELVQEVDRGKIAIAMVIEGARPIESSLEKLELFFQQGVRILTLTWNANNEVGTGAACDGSMGGLTLFGKQVVQKTAQLGMLADLSHSSRATFWDAVKQGTGNLIASHSNVDALRPHPRNLTDEQIKAIANQDGFIGICFYPGFLHTNSPSVEQIIDHIAYIGDLVGIQYVSIGADYINFAVDEIVAHMKSSGINYGTNYKFPLGVQTIRSLPNLTKRMLKRGFSEYDIRQVLGLNILRVFERAVKDI